MQEFIDDASELLNHPKLIFADMPIQESKANAALFDTTSDSKLDIFTVMAMQFLLQN